MRVYTFNSDRLACMSRGSLLPLILNRIHYSLNMRRIANYCRAVGVGLRTPLLFFFFLSFVGECWKRRREIAINVILDLVEIPWRSELNNSQWPIDGSCRSERPPKCRNVKCRLKNPPEGLSNCPLVRENPLLFE